MSSSVRAVFDCNTLLQALASPKGPAGACFKLTTNGLVSLFVSSVVVNELRNVTSRPIVIRKLRLTTERVAEFLETINIIATSLDGFAEPFTFERDPKDAHYVNLAIAADARLIVSRDKDLLDLMTNSMPEGRELLRRYPDFRVLNPSAFLAIVEVQPE